MLKQRIITAAILAPLMIAAVVYLPTLWLAVVLGIISLLAANEMANLYANWPNAVWVILLAALGALCWWVELAGTIALWAAAVSWAGALWLVSSYPESVKRLQTGALAGVPVMDLLGAVVLLGAWVALVRVHAAGGAALLGTVFLVVWAADIFAYFAGKSFGRNKLAPNVSPGKTVEGMCGGVLGAVVVGMLASWWLGSMGNLWWLGLSTAVLACVSIVGDLFESVLKRERGVKDSGTLLPGHGGVLDRVDGLLAAAPFAWLLWL